MTYAIILLVVAAPSKPDPHSQCLDGRGVTVAGLELFSHRVSYFWLQRKYFLPQHGMLVTKCRAQGNSTFSSCVQPLLPGALKLLAEDRFPWPETTTSTGHAFLIWRLEARFFSLRASFLSVLLWSLFISLGGMSKYQCFCGRPFVFPPEGFLTPTKHVDAIFKD